MACVLRIGFVVLSGSCAFQDDSGDDNINLLQHTISRDAGFLDPLPGKDCFANSDEFGEAWNCLQPETKQFCGCQDWHIGHVVRKCCPDLCSKPKRGGCGFDKTQCEAAGCKGGQACSLKAGTTTIVKKYNGKVDRELRQNVFKSGKDWCSQSNVKYCGKNGFSDPDSDYCLCNTGICSGKTPNEVDEERKIERKMKELVSERAAKATTTKKPQRPVPEAKLKERDSKKEANRKEYKVKWKARWQERREKKKAGEVDAHVPTDNEFPPATGGPDPPPPQTGGPDPPPPPQTGGPDPPPPPQTGGPDPPPPQTGGPDPPPQKPKPKPKPTNPCDVAGCRVGKESCCIKAGPTMAWKVTGDKISVKQRDKCFAQKRNWCTQGNTFQRKGDIKKR